ncbi:response regulator [Flavobacterium sp. TMP13]|uniref:response regulator n=1 Tax=unclassified Flavobacterium TaxID=196869 RepID=UPI00076D59FF|nr:response regulator [Flavobacterium sp. TAB 87]KVV16240.1 Response regulator receiver domain protein [Flavobacterium sp. TAB 87]
MSEITICYVADQVDDLLIFEDALLTIKTPTILKFYYCGVQLIEDLVLSDSTPTILFLDCNSTQLTSLEIVQIIRKSKSKKELPIIIYIDATTDEFIDRCLIAGSNLFITKSSSVNQRRSNIAQAIDKLIKHFDV